MRDRAVGSFRPWRWAATVLVVLLFGLGVWMGPTSARGNEPAGSPGVPPVAPTSTHETRGMSDGVGQQPVEVRVGDKEVFSLRRARSPETVEQRARRVSAALEGAAGKVSPEDVRIEWKGETAAIYAGRIPVVELDPADAELAGDAILAVHVDSVVSAVRGFLRAEQQRARIADRVLSISIVVSTGLVALFLVFRLGEVANRLREFVEKNPERVGAIRLRTFELLGPAALRAALLVAVGLARLLAQVAVIYGWLVLSLSMFPATLAYRERLTSAVVEPVSRFVARLVAVFPVIVVVVVAGLVLALMLRLVKLYFASLALGETRSAWVSARLAPLTSILVRGGLVLLALIIAVPLMTGNPDGGLSLVGSVALWSVGLATVPLLAAVVVGAASTYGGRVQIGDTVDVGGQVGKVATMGLFDIVIQDSSGGRTRIPHLLTLVRPIRVVPDGRRAVEVHVPSNKMGPGLAQALSDAAAQVGTAPAVALVSVGEQGVVLQVSVNAAGGPPPIELLARLSATVRDFPEPGPLRDPTT